MSAFVDMTVDDLDIGSDMLPQILYAMVVDTLVSQERMTKHGLCAGDIVRALIEYHTASACGCLPTTEKEIPDNWRQVSECLSGGVSLSSIVKDFIDPLHDRLVSCARTTGQPIEDKSLTLCRVPCLDEWAMVEQHLTQNPWIVQKFGQLRKRLEETFESKVARIQRLFS